MLMSYTDLRRCATQTTSPEARLIPQRLGGAKPRETTVPPSNIFLVDETET